MRFDLSKFKKQAVEKDHTVLAHPDGHSIKIAHKALSKKIRDQLDQLPMEKSADKLSSVAKKGKPAEEAVKMAEGGEAEDPTAQFQEPTSSQLNAPSEQQPPGIPPAVVEQNSSGFKQGPGGPIFDMDTWALTNPDKAPLAAQVSAASHLASQKDMAAQSAMQQEVDAKQSLLNSAALKDDFNAQAAKVGLPLKPYTPEEADAKQLKVSTPDAQGEGPATLKPQAQATPAQSGDSYGDVMQKGMGLEATAIEQQRRAESELGARESNIFAQQAKAQQDNIARQQELFKNAQSERDNFIHDVQNGHIKPNHYIENMGAAQKVGTAIGILISGMGGAANNMAMEFLNKQIDRDIEAQKTNLGSKENLLANNLQQFHNINDAVAMTRININDAYAAQISKAAAQARSPLAQAAATKALGELTQKNAMWMSSMGQSIGKSGGASNQVEDYMNMLRMTGQKDRLEDLEKRYIPDVGVASIPLTESKRSVITDRKLLSDNINTLMQFQQKYGGTLEGIADPRVKAEGEALTRQVQDQYRRANAQGVFKPAEAEFVSGVIADNPTSLFSKFTKMPAYKAAKQINDHVLDAEYKSVGLKPQAPSGSQAPQAFKPKTFKPSSK